MKVIKITAMWCSACIIMNNIWEKIVKDNDIEIIQGGKLHSIFGYQPGVIKKKYGIDLKQLTLVYPLEEGKKKSAFR